MGAREQAVHRRLICLLPAQKSRMDSHVPDIAADRFSYAANLCHAGSYRDYRLPFWPPASAYDTVALDLISATPDLGDGLLDTLGDLQAAIEAEWTRAKESGIAERRRVAAPGAVATVLRRLAERVPGERGRRARRRG